MASCQNELSEINTTTAFKKILKLHLFTFLQNPEEYNSKANFLTVDDMKNSIDYFMTETVID